MVYERLLTHFRKITMEDERSDVSVFINHLNVRIYIIIKLYLFHYA